MKSNSAWMAALLFIAAFSCEHAAKAPRQSLAATEEAYRQEVALKVAANWASKSSAKTTPQKDEALVLITVMNNGIVKEIVFVKEAENKAVNESVLKAIRRSEPFAAFPASFNREEIQVGIRPSPHDDDGRNP